MGLVMIDDEVEKPLFKLFAVVVRKVQGFYAHGWSCGSNSQSKARQGRENERFRRGNPYKSFGYTRIKRGRFEQSPHLFHRLSDDRCDLVRSLGWYQPLRGAHEQRIIEHIPQAPKRSTDRRLCDEQPFRSPGDVAFLKQHVQDLQQVQVGTQKSLVHLTILL
ncbi:MAG: hypothetical protein JWQ90_4786 [Hydrocarboniphaga sp.]|nr:hypothetical protein [Hydrocarboniphaga sp.]